MGIKGDNFKFLNPKTLAVDQEKGIGDLNITTEINHN